WTSAASSIVDVNIGARVQQIAPFAVVENGGNVFGPAIALADFPISNTRMAIRQHRNRQLIPPRIVGFRIVNHRQQVGQRGHNGGGLGLTIATLAWTVLSHQSSPLGVKNPRMSPRAVIAPAIDSSELPPRWLEIIPTMRSSTIL